MTGVSCKHISIFEALSLKGKEAFSRKETSIMNNVFDKKESQTLITGKSAQNKELR